MGKNRNEYIHNVASTVLGQTSEAASMLAFVKASYNDEDDVFPVSFDAFWRQYGTKIMEIVSKMGPSARGKIVACGGRSVVYTNLIFAEWMDAEHPRPKDGNEVLTLLASDVVSHAIVNLLVAQAAEDLWDKD